MAYVISDDCIACGVCTDACPQGALSVEDVCTVSDACIDCGTCIDECPVGAISE